MKQITYLPKVLQKYKAGDYQGAILACKRFQQSSHGYGLDVSIDIRVLLRLLLKNKIRVERNLFYHLQLSSQDPKPYMIAKRQLTSGYSRYGLEFFERELLENENNALANKIRFELLLYYFSKRDYEKSKYFCQQIDDEIFQAFKEYFLYLLRLVSGDWEHADGAFNDLRGKIDAKQEALLASMLCKAPDAERLAAINTLFESAGIQTLRLREPNKGYRIDNLTGAKPVSIQNKHMVSVIMPVFNAQDTLEYAVRSIQEQSWSNLELLCVDDASTDGSLEILQHMAKEDGRIRVFHLKKNRGCYFCRNVALRNAKGYFVTVQDSDDWSHPDRLRLQASDLVNDLQTSGNCSFYIKVDNNMRQSYNVFFPALLFMNYSSFMFRRSYVHEIGFWDNARFSADAEYINRFSQYYDNDKVKKIYPDIPLCFVYLHDSSLTRTSSTSIDTLNIYNGPRFLYRQLFLYSHKNKSKEVFCQCAFARPRAAKSKKHESYDCICVTDFSLDSQSLEDFIQTINNRCCAGMTVAALNWARHDLLEFNLNADVAELFNKYRVDLISTADTVNTKELLFFNSGLYRYLPDNLPQIKSETTLLFSDEDNSDEAMMNLKQAFGCKVVEGDRQYICKFHTTSNHGV